MAKINLRLKVQQLNIPNDSLRLKTPFCMSISGPSQGMNLSLIIYCFIYFKSFNNLISSTLLETFVKIYETTYYFSNL